jgi:hypothetical protein
MTTLFAVRGMQPYWTTVSGLNHVVGDGDDACVHAGTDSADK